MCFQYNFAIYFYFDMSQKPPHDSIKTFCLRAMLKPASNGIGVCAYYYYFCRKVHSICCHSSNAFFRNAPAYFKKKTSRYIWQICLLKTCSMLWSSKYSQQRSWTVEQLQGLHHARLGKKSAYKHWKCGVLGSQMFDRVLLGKERWGNIVVNIS